MNNPKIKTSRRPRPNDNRPENKPVPHQTLLERVVAQKWLLKEAGDPKRVALFLGIVLARFSRRGGFEPKKEERTVLGQKMNVALYPTHWWDRHGDGIVQYQLSVLKEHPELLDVLPGDKPKE
jgi:hypothetical protein